MKAKKIKLMTLLMVLVLSIGACEKDEDGTATPKDELITVYNGAYSGYAYDGTTRVASWKISIDNGTISSVSSSETDNVSITGKVNNQGEITATTVDGDGHALNITGTISETNISGTWLDTVEGDSGTFTGNKDSSIDVNIYNGTYSGYAYDGTTRVASWKISINNGTISSVGTSEIDNVSITGKVNNQGEITATTVDGDGHALNITGSISGTSVSGTWLDTVEGDSGTFTGVRNN